MNWSVPDFIIYLTGFCAQLLFSARLLVQWILSEKVKKVLTPELFWELSLAASFLMFAYGWMRDDFAIMLGQTLTYFIYIRNMQIQKTWKKLPLTVRFIVYTFPVAVIFYSFNNNQTDIIRLFKNKNIPPELIIWGSVAQVIFTLRFVYQWIISEHKNKSQLPEGFWILSLTGSFMILIYAVIRKDPVLFIGQIFGFIIYLRNIIIGNREKKR
ncbi:MAG: lauroyl acyltransferase [Chlorobi bacterium]|nr:lauroyl acyltransferase [Chlorobiota bacterium]